MPPRASACQVCTHDKRASIELGLTYGTPLRVLSQRFEVSKDALHRHRHKHLSPQLQAALLANRKPSEIDLEKLQADESQSLLSQLVSQRARLQQQCEIATELHDVKAAVACERAITDNLALVSKLLGMLVQRHEIRSTSILVSPDYLQLRSVLVNALRPFPEAAQAVSAALHKLETAAASDITAAAGKRPLMIEATAEATTS